MRKFIEGVGRFVGETAGAEFLKWMRSKLERFNLETAGQKYPESLKDRQYLLVANHLMPESGKAQQSQLSPDAFVLERLIHEITGQELKIISKCDDGWWGNNLYRYFQRHISQPFGKGMSEGMGFIPLEKNPGSFNRDFVKIVENVVAEGKDPILMFPEGHWFEDYDPKHELETGAGHIASKHQLPILPAYIHGARSWEPDSEVQVVFGEPFEPGQLTKEEITEQIRLRLTELQKSSQAKK